MKPVIRILDYTFLVLLIAASFSIGANQDRASEVSKKVKATKFGWIGVVIQDINEKLANTVKLENEEGAYVKEVVEESPADSAGIFESDVIVEFNGKKIYDSDDLIKAVRKTLPGTKVNLIVLRDSKKKTIQLTVGKNKAVKNKWLGAFPPKADVRVFVGNGIIGLKLLPLNEQLGEYFNAPNNEGVLVEEVVKESAAEKAGFKAGDIIVRIGKKTVVELGIIRRELQKYDEGDKVEFEVLRRGGKKLLSVELEEDFSENKFFLRKPHLRMFHVNPFDETDGGFNIDEIVPELDGLEIQLEQTMGNFKKKQQEMEEYTRQILLPSLERI